jgi:hypothetical protein
MVVYLDTNVYYGAKFVFDSGKFETLKSYINDGVVKLLYTSATVGEVFRRMEDIEKEIIVYNRTIRKNLENFKIAEDLSIAEISAQDVIENRKKKLEGLLALPGVECISLNPLDAEQLMNDYFQQRPPFENQKPHEFKDAIMINAIRNYQKKINDTVCVVSDDDGFRKAFEGNNNFSCFKYISQFFKYIQEQTELDEYYTTLIQDGFFEEEIFSYLEDLDIDRSDYSEWEYDDKEFYDADFELSYIERGEDPNQLLLHINIEYNISVEITHRDEDQSYYDKEEGRYLIEEYVTWREFHFCCEDLIVVCEIINSGETFEFVKIISDRKYHYLDLSDETMVDFDEISTSKDEEPDLVYCSQCNSIIGTTAYYFDYQDNPLCDQCMVCDSHGTICPSCGKKFPYEHTIDGFCEECFSND